MHYGLNDLVSDFRLHHLFGDDDSLTVTQIWVLEIQGPYYSELRFLYGRSLPGTYQSDSWSGTTTSKTSLPESGSAKTHALTLHTSALRIKIFLEHFIAGEPLSSASQMAGIQLNDKLAMKVGGAIFGANPIARPVMHLPTRDYFRFRTSRLSPTSYASVDSAAMSSEGKAVVFNHRGGSERTIATAACLSLNADTGLDFTALDAWRVGDFEFICSPSLTRAERSKYDITLSGCDATIQLFEPLTREKSDLLLVLNAHSDDSIQATYTTVLDKEAGFPLNHSFRMEALKNRSSTSFTLEIYALSNGPIASYLVLQTGSYFVGSVNLSTHMIEPISLDGKLGWLEKQVPKKDRPKLEVKGRVERAIRTSRSVIGGHWSDPWVDLNRLTEDGIKQLFPKPSKGRFFLKLADSGGTSRLQLTDWLREIFDQHHDAQIAWIDPFMEDVGVELLHRMGTSTGDYLIITTEKAAKDDDISVKAPKYEGSSLVNQSGRVERLINSCNEWSRGYFGNVRLKVLAVPDSKIHDRMILIRSSSGKPLGGYHLSNSIQRANESYPLLATPIPLDVIPHVFDYADQIIQSTLHGDGKQVPTAKLIFDSTTAAHCAGEGKETEGLHHRSSFVEAPRAGDVLAWWLDDQELAGLSGKDLMGQLEAKGTVTDGHLDRGVFDSVAPKLWTEGLPLEDFNSAWDAMGFVLANSPSGDFYTKRDTPFPEDLKNSLLDYLSPLRDGALRPRRRNALLNIEFYRSQDLSSLLLSSYEPHAIFPYSPVDTSWGDYYALKLLWAHAPQALVEFITKICADPIKDERTHALVVEAFRHICLCFGFEKIPAQIDALMQSEASLVAWVGLHAFKDAINSGVWGIDSLSKIDRAILAGAQRAILCWMINEANFAKAVSKPYLISKLTESLDGALTDGELKDILEPVRGRLGRLHHFTPWILESLLLPMLERRVVDPAQISREWLNDLMTQWRNALNGQSLHFTLEADGAFTDELAVLTSLLAPEEREAIVSALRSIFDSLARTIRLPLGSQISWRSHSCAHGVNLWLYSLSRRILALVDAETNQPLAELLQECESIIDRLPDSDRQVVTSAQLVTYAKGDPDQIRSHGLRHIICTAIA